MIDLESTESGVIVPVRAQAGARKNALLGERQGMLRVAVTAAPEKGKANRAIIELLSRSLRISKSSIELISGPTSSEKRFLLRGWAVDQARQAIGAFIAED